ncbi:hypothetical protein C8R46DRAFT_1189311 [Mycena filopes]|nr:hypothetical protein C8R46DRAFT_1189311 [Mycena filopes]
MEKVKIRRTRKIPMRAAVQLVGTSSTGDAQSAFSFDPLLVGEDVPAAPVASNESISALDTESSPPPTHAGSPVVSDEPIPAPDAGSALVPVAQSTAPVGLESVVQEPITLPGEPLESLDPTTLASLVRSLASRLQTAAPASPSTPLSPGVIASQCVCAAYRCNFDILAAISSTKHRLLGDEEEARMHLEPLYYQCETSLSSMLAEVGAAARRLNHQTHPG